MAADNSAAVSQQQPAQEQPVSNSQLRDNQSTATTQQQSGNKPTQQQPVDNRQLSLNQSTKAAQQQQVTTTTSINNLFGPALQLNVGAEGVCQRRPPQNLQQQLVLAKSSCEDKALRLGAAPPPSWVPSLAIPIGGGGGVGTTSTQRREEKEYNMAHQMSSKASALDKKTHRNPSELVQTAETPEL